MHRSLAGSGICHGDAAAATTCLRRLAEFSVRGGRRNQPRPATTGGILSSRRMAESARTCGGWRNSAFAADGGISHDLRRLAEFSVRGGRRNQPRGGWRNSAFAADGGISHIPAAAWTTDPRRLAESCLRGGRRNQPQIRGGWRKSFLRPMPHLYRFCQRCENWGSHAFWSNLKHFDFHHCTCKYSTVFIYNVFGYIYILLISFLSSTNMYSIYRYVQGVNVDRGGGATDFKLNTVQGSHLCMWKSFAMASRIGDVCEAARAGLGNLLFFQDDTWWYQKPKLEKERERPSRVRTPEPITFQHALWFYQVKLEADKNQNLWEFARRIHGYAAVFLDRLSLKWTRKSSQDMVAHNAVASACAKAQQWLEACAESAVFQCSYVFVSFEVFLDDEFSDIYS